MKKRFIVVTAVMVCFVLNPSHANADTWLQSQMLTAADGASGDSFGHSVSIGADYAIVGAYNDDNNGADSGSVYILKRDGNTWAQQQMLTALDGAVNDWFGYSVSISGDYAIAGAIYDDNNGANSGSVYIFKRDGALWSQLQMLTAADGAAGDIFGCSVSISGDYAIVGAYNDDNIGTNSGSVYILKRNGVAWAQTQMQTATDGAAGDWFGCSVSMCGDYAIVGAPGDDNNAANSGSVYIFKRDGVIWVQTQMLTASDSVAGDLFGYSVSISNDYAIVGAYNDDNKGTDSGAVYILKRNGAVWAEQQMLTASDGAAGDHYGYSVSISEDYAAVGAYSDDNIGTDSGSVYMLKRNGAIWAELQMLTASDGAAADYFGYSVSINTDSNTYFALVGAKYDDNLGANSGSAYLYMLCPRADLNDDCTVDLADFAVMADWWLYGTD